MMPASFTPAPGAAKPAGTTISRIAFAVCLVAPCISNGSACAADALSSPWSSAARSAARLIASGTFEDGVYHGGVEIKLDPGTLTYWRTPGDAGVPPAMAFGGSANLAKATVRFPAPKRYLDGRSQSFGYKGDVIFPIDVAPKDVSRPVELVLDLHYATCDQICLPAEAKMHLLLAPGGGPGPEAARIAAARAEVPQIVAADGERGLSVVRLAGTGEPTWKVKFHKHPGAAAALFAEAPDGWYFDTKRNRGFDLVLAQKPPQAKGPVPVTLTLVDGGAAYQSTIHLDATPPTP